MKQEIEILEQRLELLRGELLKRFKHLQDRAQNSISALAIVGPDMRAQMMLMSDPVCQRLQDEIVKAEGELSLARIADENSKTTDRSKKQHLEVPPSRTKAQNKAKAKEAVREAGGNKSEAARNLGISRKTLYDWLG